MIQQLEPVDLQARATDLPHLWFATRDLGLDTTHWVKRQVRWIDRLDTRVVCWVPAEEDADVDKPVVVLPGADRRPGKLGRVANELRAELTDCNSFGVRGEAKRRLREMARERRPDVIMAHFGYIALGVLPIAREFDIPLVAYFHGLDISSMLRGRAYRRSLLANLKHFDQTIAVGRHQAEWLVDHGVPRDRVHLIVSGTRTELFLPSPTRPDAPPLRLIAVSRLVEQKGVDYALRSVAEARREVDVTLDIVGDGEERAALEALAKELGIAGSVTFHGSIPSERVAEIMPECHAFVQHSLLSESGWIEGFGNSITEASSCELPAIVTDCGGINDQISDDVNGLVTPQRDVPAMARSIVRLARDADLRRRLGKAGRRRAVEEFDAKTSLRRLEDVLLHAAAAGKKTASFPQR